MTVQYIDDNPAPVSPDLLAAVDAALKARERAERYKGRPMHDPRDLAERALHDWYGERDQAIEQLVRWAQSDSIDFEAVTGAERPLGVEPPAAERIRSSAAAHIDAALARHGKKQPWPKRPAPPEPPKPRTADDYAVDALARTRANPPSSTPTEWALPRYEQLQGSTIGESKLVGTIPVTMPALSVEEAAAHLLLRWAQTDSEVAAAVLPMPGVVHYELGSQRDLERCRALIGKAAKL